VSHDAFAGNDLMHDAVECCLERVCKAAYRPIERRSIPGSVQELLDSLI